MSVRVLEGDCRAILATLPPQSVQCCVTSPPYYGLRDYGVAGQMGLEPNLGDYIAGMVDVFREVRRVLADDGVLWLNVGDSYNAYNGNRGASMSISANTNEAVAKLPSGAGLTEKAFKAKDLLMVPARLALALQADGWWLRSDCIWAKPNPMPESVTDRPTSAHEHVFMLTKAARYFYDAEAVREECTVPDWANGTRAFGGVNKGADLAAGGDHTKGRIATSAPEGRNLRNVWTIATQPFPGSHFATMPPDLAERCIKSASRPGDTVLDPFGGAGTTGLVADRLRRNALLIELNPEYAAMARERIRADAGLLADVA